MILNPAKAAELMEMLFSVDSGGLKEACIRWGPYHPTQRGNFEGAKGQSIIKYRTVCRELCKNC